MPNLQLEVAKDFQFSLGLKPHGAVWLPPMQPRWPRKLSLFCFDWKAHCCVVLDIYFTLGELYLGMQWWWVEKVVLMGIFSTFEP